MIGVFLSSSHYIKVKKSQWEQQLSLEYLNLGSFVLFYVPLSHRKLCLITQNTVCLVVLCITCVCMYTPLPSRVCVCMCVCACMYFCSPWRCIIFSQPPFFRCRSSSDNQWCSSFSGLSCGPSSSDQGPSSAEDNPAHCAETRETNLP